MVQHHSEPSQTWIGDSFVSSAVCSYFFFIYLYISFFEIFFKRTRALLDWFGLIYIIKIMFGEGIQILDTEGIFLNIDFCGKIFI